MEEFDEQRSSRSRWFFRRLPSCPLNKLRRLPIGHERWTKRLSDKLKRKMMQQSGRVFDSREMVSFIFGEGRHLDAAHGNIKACHQHAANQLAPPSLVQEQTRQE